MLPVHLVWPKPSCKVQRKEEKDKADRRRGGKTASGNGQALNLPSPRGQWRTEEKKEKKKKEKKKEETGCEIIWGALTTLTVEG